MNGAITESCTAPLIAASLAAVRSIMAPPGVAGAADTAEGRRIAEQWCTSCHLVGGRREGQGGTDDAPALALAEPEPARNARLGGLLRHR